MKRSRSTTPLAVMACAVTLLATHGMEARQAAPAGQPAAQGRGGRGGRGGGIGNPVFSAADVNKDGALSKTELEGAFAQWYGSWSGGAGPLTQEDLAKGLSALFPQIAGGGGRGGQNQTPNPADVQAMTAALPATAPAKPKQPRKVLVLAKAQGFVHSSIPLAAKTVEALGTKTGAWATTITYDPADITDANLKQYDAIFLDNTTGTFLDDPNDPAATAARRKALLDFVRGGKGLAGIHAASDSYHGNPSPAPAARGGGGGGISGMLAGTMLAQGDHNSDQKLSKDEMTALADTWFEKIDTDKTGTVSQADFNTRFATVFNSPGGRGAAGPPPPNEPLWPEFNKMIGAYFKWHWLDPQEITVKIDDPKSPLTAMFHGPFVIHDETYTFQQDSFTRDNVHVLTSIDYAKMSPEDKAKEPEAGKRTDGDYALSWIRKEGQGRVFYEAHGHSERIYAMTPMLEHLLAGIQYALGDLEADATPSGKGSIH